MYVNRHDDELLWWRWWWCCRWLMELVGLSLRFEVAVVWMWFWLSRKRIKEKLISGGLQVGVLTVVSANTNRTPRKMDGWLQV